MMKLDPIIAVKDVLISSKWYENLFGLKNAHGGANFAVLQDNKGNTILCLHHWGDHGHPSMMKPNQLHGNGLILYLKTEDFDSIYKTALQMNIEIAEVIHLNPNSHKMEFSVRDLDGYFITITEYHNYEG